MRQIATYTEIMTSWSFNDLADAHEVIDLQDSADAWFSEQSRLKAEREHSQRN